MRDAIRVALPRSARAITTAGVTLAGSFALIALVPLLTFAELAFAMAVGPLIDTFVVRSLLTPALLSLGRWCAGTTTMSTSPSTTCGTGRCAWPPVTARLYGVHVALHAVVTGGVSSVFVERTHETAVFSYADLNAYPNRRTAR